MKVQSFSEQPRNFIKCIEDGRLREAEQLLKSAPDIAADRNAADQTPLHWLVIEGHTEGVRLLIQHGADANCEDCSGNFPLADAAALELSSMVTALLEGGADINKSHVTNKETALHVAARHSRDPEIAELLLAAGAAVNARDHLMCTPLHAAASFDNRDFAKVLLSHGADRSAQDEIECGIIDVVPEELRAEWASFLDIDDVNEAND